MLSHPKQPRFWLAWVFRIRLGARGYQRWATLDGRWVNTMDKPEWCDDVLVSYDDTWCEPEDA